MRNPRFLEKSMLPEGHKRLLRELVPPGHGHAETNPGACRPLIAFSALLFFSRKRRSCRGRGRGGEQWFFSPPRWHRNRSCARLSGYLLRWITGPVPGAAWWRTRDSWFLELRRVLDVCIALAARRRIHASYRLVGLASVIRFGSRLAGRTLSVPARVR